MHRLFILLVATLATAFPGKTQVCTNAGQTPSSAILLCGSGEYSVSQIPICGQLNLPTACPQTSTYQNTNPTWFRLDCFRSGTLGFTITPHWHTDNFDWQLFDVTGRNDDDVLSDPSLFLACNWCPDPGETGASQDGTRLTVCTESSQELFSAMPDLVAGHEYLLLVAHRSPNENGFKIALTSGTASVTDPLEPQLVSARLACNGTQLFVFFNKEMECASIAADGSDFSLNAPTSILDAQFTCIAGRTGTVTLTLSAPLAPGNYSVRMRIGTDGDGILDRCVRAIPDGSSVPVQMPVLVPAVMDSLAMSGCSPEELRLFFRKPIQCNSVAFDGSDFRISGQQPVSIAGISIDCNTQTRTTQHITLRLGSPILAGGNYQISLVTGSDGNTLVDECGGPLAPASLSFPVQSSVAANFSYTLRPSCKQDTLDFSALYTQGVSHWDWTIDQRPGPNLPFWQTIFPATGDHSIRLIVSNGTCSDTAIENIHLNNRVTAHFEGPAVICPEDPVRFVNRTEGKVDTWLWSFGANNGSNQQDPADFHYPPTGREEIYTVQLVAVNQQMNCRDSFSRRVQVLGSCFIAVPTAFSPNGDGLNDLLFPANALKADRLLFQVYNRTGQLVFETRDWTRRWDGRVLGQPQPAGVYAWLLRYTNRDTGEKIFRKGTTLLLR